ncbi:MAG: lipocalin/fatty-acid binding family protein [Vicinamibacteraceae bacterium]
MPRTSSHVTTDHDEIRRWVEDRGGHPSRVAGTGEQEDPGLLRIDFPGYGGEESLGGISWDEFFRKFNEKGLAFVYQEQTTGGEKSVFSKLVSRDCPGGAE